MTSPDLSDQVRLAGLRVTGRPGSVSTQAVYDVLVACTRAGLVRRIEPAGHSARFERRIGDKPSSRGVPQVWTHGGRRLRGRRPAVPGAQRRPRVRPRRG